MMSIYLLAKAGRWRWKPSGSGTGFLASLSSETVWKLSSSAELEVPLLQV